MNKFTVDHWVEERAMISAKQFYPALPAKELGMPIAEVFLRLIELAKDRKLKIDFLKGKNYKTERDLIPIFSFAPEYLERIKQHKDV
jgi:hypothetical protein